MALSSFFHIFHLLDAACPLDHAIHPLNNWARTWSEPAVSTYRYYVTFLLLLYLQMFSKLNETLACPLNCYAVSGWVINADVELI